MLRDEIVAILLARHNEEGADEWVSFEALAHALGVNIADVMYETGVLCDQRMAQRTGHRGSDLISLTQKGLEGADEDL